MAGRVMGEFDPNMEYRKGDVVTIRGEAYKRVRDDGGKVDPFQTMPYTVWQKQSGASGQKISLLAGGGTPNAVQYTPQELTEEQQMQARKNIAAANNWNDMGEKVKEYRVTATEGVDSFNFGTTFVKVSDDLPTPEQLSACVVCDTENGNQIMTGAGLYLYSDEAVCHDRMIGLLCVVYSTTFTANGKTYEAPSTGVYLSTGNDAKNMYVKITEITPIPPEYLPVPMILFKDGTLELNCSAERLKECFECGLLPLYRVCSTGETTACTYVTVDNSNSRYRFKFDELEYYVNYTSGEVTESGGK